MDVFLTTLKALIDGLGATIALPIIIFIVALVLGAKPGKAFRAGVIIGIAFIGINLVIGLMWGALSDVGQALVKNLGITRDVVDVGWPSAAAIAFGTKVGLWVIPIAILVNVVMLFLRWTKTLNVDIWNFWHFAFIGSMVAAVSGNLAYGLIAAALAAALALFLGDWTAKAVQSFYGLPGISIPHLTTAPGVPFAIFTNWLVDRIPGLNKVNADPEAIRKRFGIMGEPVILGLIIGLILGILGFYNAGELPDRSGQGPWTWNEPGRGHAAPAPHGLHPDGRLDAGLRSCARVHAEACWQPRDLHWSGFRHPHWPSCRHFDITPARPDRHPALPHPAWQPGDPVCRPGDHPVRCGDVCSSDAR